MNERNFQIVSYQDGDAQSVWDLHMHIVRSHEGFLKNTLFYCDMKNIKNHYESFFLLKKLNETIGMVGIKKVEDNVYEIKRLQVHSNYQNLGYGKKLLNTILKEAKKLRAEKLVLDFDKRRDYLKDFYALFGFKEYGIKKVLLGPDDEEFDLILMEKWLDK